MVVAGFEPLDVLQSIWMVLRQIAEGRCEIENQYARIVPEAGNTPALRAVSRVYELREFFEWRGLGSIDHSGIGSAKPTPGSTPSRNSPSRTCRSPTPNPASAARC